MIKLAQHTNNLRYKLPLFITVIFIAILLILPTGFEEAIATKGAERVMAEVITANDHFIVDTGLIRTGEQICSVIIKQGRYKGEIAEATNLLRGSLESDKIFMSGDKALVVISHQGGIIGSISMVDHYRIHYEIILAAIFVLFLVLFAKETGLRAVLSFVATILAIWKLLVPAYLKGFNPIWTGIVVTLLITVLIISLVYGFNRKALAAILGAALGIVCTGVMGVISTNRLRIHGAVMSGSESLIYSGFEHLNLTLIFMASIFIGSSGAMMDLAVDITSAVHEVIQKKPEMDWMEATKSGLNIGRAAMGTMTTTLLLAYSGGYIALMMVFMAQGTPVLNIVNYKYIAAEFAHTIVGSFGLVLVAPFTALTSGILLTGEKNKLEL